MPPHRRSLLAASLVVAVSCSDTGTPIDFDAPGKPDWAPASVRVLQSFACTVDAVAGTEACDAASPRTGNALGVVVAIGNVAYAQKLTTTVLNTADSLHQEVRIVNLIPQALGTTDGLTLHPYGIRVWVEPAVNIVPVDPGQPASVTVANPYGVMTWNGTIRNRPYFWYPELLPAGDTSATQTWKFARQNVSSFQYAVYIAAEVQFHRGWMDVDPAAPTLQVDSGTTLAAHSRGPFGQLQGESNVVWTTSDDGVVVVSELSPSDTLAQVVGVAPGTAWVRAASSLEPVLRRDSVLVTVN